MGGTSTTGSVKGVAGTVARSVHSRSTSPQQPPHNPCDTSTSSGSIQVCVQVPFHSGNLSELSRIVLTSYRRNCTMV